MGPRGREPRAFALGWYETGLWPEREGTFSYAQIGKRRGHYIRIYIVPIYGRDFGALLSWLLKNSGLLPGRTLGQPDENSRNPQNPICAPEAGWQPAVAEGQNASPGGLWPSNLSIKCSDEPGFVPSSGRFLARMKFSSPGMLTAEREPTEDMTISLPDFFVDTSSC